MNKTVIFISFAVSAVLVNFGMSIKKQADGLRNEIVLWQADNESMRVNIKGKSMLGKKIPVPLPTAYNVVLNQIRYLEGFSGTSMNVQLEDTADTLDVSRHYENTPYEGIKGLRIKIVVDKFSKETDMGAVLDDIHLLEMNTDFMASQIRKDNDNLIVKGEIYGV